MAMSACADEGVDVFKLAVGGWQLAAKRNAETEDAESVHVRIGLKTLQKYESLQTS